MELNDCSGDAPLFPVSQAYELEKQSFDQQWLIDSIWTRTAVGIIGGAPKCCKSWFGLDMAVSVASATPCLDQFTVQQQGTVLIYLAEDDLSSVRSRVESLCFHRKLDIQQLELYVITSSTLRLDLETDRQRLSATLETYEPVLLILDPLVRLHRVDENSSSDISRLLGFLRELQREYQCAVVLVHHASKKHHAQPGQALRGSSDLHAFGDSNAYLTRKNKRLILTLEHRSAKPPEPIELELSSSDDNAATHLKIVSFSQKDTNLDLGQRLIALLKNENLPLKRNSLRERLKVNNQRLGHALQNLEKLGMILKTENGWIILGKEQTPTTSNQLDLPISVD